jgi:hypothetical protein
LVKSELYQLEKLIGEIVNDEKVSGNERHPTGIAERIQSVIASCSNLKEKWVHELFRPVKEPVVARYVQYHQAGITSLSNQVSMRIPATYFQGIENQIHQLYFIVVSSLEDLLQFLKQGFYKYFDNDYTVSIDHCRVQAEQIHLLLAETQVTLRQSGIDAPLVSAVALSITHKLADAKQWGISYRQLDYYKSILRTISQQLSGHSGITTIRIAQELYRQNFNSYHFNQWYQVFLGSIINAASENKKETIILQEIKLLKLIFVAREKIFEPELPPINDQLLTWLQQLLPGQSTPNLKEILKMNGHERMPLQFSVTQFALFVRLCYLEGCFHVNNISDILRFFTQHFETKKQLNISFKSFARAFYGAEQGTAAVVRDFLQRMINTINKIYFP